MASWDWLSVWHKSRENWHWPQLPMPREAAGSGPDDFLFQDYRITLSRDLLSRVPTIWRTSSITLSYTTYSARALLRPQASSHWLHVGV